MRVKPGDRVVIPFSDRVSDTAVVRIREELTRVMPGVQWGIIDGTSLTHALVYEGDAGPAQDAQAMLAAIAKFQAALVRLDVIIATFTEKGSIGGIDNVLRSRWQNVDQVAEWAQWSKETRAWLKENL